MTTLALSGYHKISFAKNYCKMGSDSQHLFYRGNKNFSSSYHVSSLGLSFFFLWLPFVTHLQSSLGISFLLPSFVALFEALAFCSCGCHLLGTS